MNDSVRAELRRQANDIYTRWEQGSKSTAEAMLRQVPFSRQAYVVLCMTNLSNHEGMQYAFAHFIEEYTQ